MCFAVLREEVLQKQRGPAFAGGPVCSGLLLTGRKGKKPRLLQSSLTTCGHRFTPAEDLVRGICISHIDKAIFYVLLLEGRKQEMYLMSICIKLVSVIRSVWLSDMSCPHGHVAPALIITKTFSFFPGVQLQKTTLGVRSKLEVYKALMAEMAL